MKPFRDGKFFGRKLREGVQDVSKADLETAQGVFSEEPLAPGVTELTLRIGNETTTQQFHGVHLTAPRNNSSELLTTHPDLVIAGVRHGPAGMEESVTQEPTTIITLERSLASDTLLQYTMVVHDGLLTAYEDYTHPQLIRSRGFATNEETVSSYENYKYNNPVRIYNRVKIAQSLPTYWSHIKGFEDTFKALGFRTEDHDTKKSYTMPLPHEFSKRWNERLEDDTASGLYYPQLALLTGGRLPVKDFLEVYSYGLHPVGVENYFYFTHDMATGHMGALMVYGEPLMDLVKNYARAGLATAESREDLVTAGNTIDNLTDNLGVGPKYTHNEEIVNNLFQMVTKLRTTNGLDNLKIVQWMRDKDMLAGNEKINTTGLYKGLNAYVRERFGEERLAIRDSE